MAKIIIFLAALFRKNTVIVAVKIKMQDNLKLNILFYHDVVPDNIEA